MLAMPRPNKKAKNAPLYQKKWFAVVVSGAVVLLLGWLFVVDPVLDQRDKQRFLRAEAEIEEILETKILPVAEPDDIRKEQICRYSGVKYAQGTLSCSVRTELFYESVDPIQTTEIISAELDLPLRDTNNTEISVSDIQEDETFYVYQSIPQDNVNCGISYSKDSGRLHVTISCSDTAKAEHFSVQ